MKKNFFLENDDNLSYFPSINNSNRVQPTFLNNTNNGLFNDLLPNNSYNTNPVSTLGTNTFGNNRQQSYKSLSNIIYPQQQQAQAQAQQQQIRNDENVFHNNQPYANSV